MGQFSGLSAALSNVAEKLKADRTAKQEMEGKKDLLGYEGLMKGTITPTSQEEEGTFNIPGIGNVVSNPNMPIYEKDASGNYVQKGIVPKGSKVISSKPKEEGGKTLVAPMIDKISKNEDAYYSLGNSLNDLTSNADKYSQFMGPGKAVLRNPIRSYVNKDLQNFLGWKANVQDAFQQYRVAVTGAQASDGEIALLAKNRPTENDTYDVFVKKTNAVRKIGNQVITRYIKNLEKSGYNVSGYQDTLDSLNSELGNLGENQNIKPDIISIQDVTGKTIQIPRQEAIRRGYING